jgi:DNA-binding MarR family transcriptional regulator
MDREDLGALLVRATRRLLEAERQLLDGHGLSMWDYVVLSRVAREPARSQLVLAEAIGYDKTRLVTLLDALEHKGLVTRERDPDDRRARIVHLTTKGRKAYAAAQASIRTMEDRLLAGVSPAAREHLFGTLEELTSDSSPEDQSG